MSKSVLAVVVSFNDGHALKKTVAALAPQVGKVVIVDNGSDPETLKCIAELEAELGIKSVCCPENMGVGAALNIGVSIAREEKFEWLLTMDQDSVAAPKMVTEMLVSAEKCQDAAVICPTLTADKIDKKIKDKITGSAITSGNLVRIRYLQAVGDYNESYFIDSVDFEFNLRVRNAGYKIIRCGAAKLSHRLGEAKTFCFMRLRYRYTLHAPIRRYYMYRNHVCLVMKFWYKNPVFLIKKTIMAVAAMVEIAVLDPRRWGNFKMIWRGLLDGFKLKGGIFNQEG